MSEGDTDRMPPVRSAGEEALAASPRPALMAKNFARLDPAERRAIRDRASEILGDLDAL